MIWLQDSVPQNYVNDSRDFQLFCRLYDCINNGVRFDIESMIYLFDPIRCNNRILNLLATKVGFFPKCSLSDIMLRYIISSFPYLMKYKGSKTAISYAVATVLKAENISAQADITIYTNNHCVGINIDKEYNELALKEILEYILPIGYTFELVQSTKEVYAEEFDNINIVYSYIDSSSATSQVIDAQPNWVFPTYSIISKEKVEQAFAPSRFSEEVEENNITYTKITYTYYEKENNELYEKVMEIKIPHNDTNRYIGNMIRSEVIGSNNHTESNNDEGIKPSDIIINDIGEQGSDISLLFNIVDNTLLVNEVEGNLIKLTTISIDKINVPMGTQIIPSNNDEDKLPSYIQDIKGNVALVTSIETNADGKITLNIEVVDNTK